MQWSSVKQNVHTAQCEMCALELGAHEVRFVCYFLRIFQVDYCFGIYLSLRVVAVSTVYCIWIVHSELINIVRCIMNRFINNRSTWMATQKHALQQQKIIPYGKSFQCINYYNAISKLLLGHQRSFKFFHERKSCLEICCTVLSVIVT